MACFFEDSRYSEKPSEIKLPLVLKTTHFNHRDREETADFLKLYNGLNQLEKQTNKKLSTVTLEARGKHCYMYHNGCFCLRLSKNYETVESMYFNLSNCFALGVILKLRTKVLKKWYFVTKIFLTYCEKELL